MTPNCRMIHVLPINDLKEHEESATCWCRPYCYDYEGVCVHNSMDRREEYEQGRKTH